MNANSYRRALLALTASGLVSAERAAQQLGDKALTSAAVAARELELSTPRQYEQPAPKRPAKPRRSLRRG